MVSGSASRCASSSKRCSAFSSFWRIDAFIFSYSLAAMQPRHLTHAVLQLLMAGRSLISAAPCPAWGSSTASRETRRIPTRWCMTAEIALQRDDCGRAAANYTIAAQRLADAKLAERAAGVALDCGQYQAAERAAARWRQLMPGDPAALRAVMRADLGLYKIDDARSAFESWIKSGGGVAPVKGGRGGAADDEPCRAGEPGSAGIRRVGDLRDAARRAGRAAAERAGAAGTGRSSVRWLELSRSAAVRLSVP
jgi:hypothetical protein